MSYCKCCDLDGGWTEIPQPGQGFILTQLCENTTIKYLKIAAGQEFACYQAAFYSDDGLVTDDADPTKFAGFMVHSVDSTVANYQVAPPVFVAGTFDADQAIFATASWDDPAMAEAMRDRDIFLEQRK